MPGSWALQGHGTPVYLNIRMPFALHAPDVPADNPTAVYRRRFRLPTGWRARRTFVRIGSADAMAWVWVNGSFVGMGKDSRLASTFEITDRVGKGDNEIAIVVPQWSDASWIEDQDQWWLPGAPPLGRVAVGATGPSRRLRARARSRRRRHDGPAGDRRARGRRRSGPSRTADRRRVGAGRPADRRHRTAAGTHLSVRSSRPGDGGELPVARPARADHARGPERRTVDPRDAGALRGHGHAAGR